MRLSRKKTATILALWKFQRFIRALFPFRIFKFRANTRWPNFIVWLLALYGECAPPLQFCIICPFLLVQRFPRRWFNPETCAEWIIPRRVITMLIIHKRKYFILCLEDNGGVMRWILKGSVRGQGSSELCRFFHFEGESTPSCWGGRAPANLFIHQEKLTKKLISILCNKVFWKMMIKKNLLN